MKKHFVIFYSPGTLFAETTEMPIPDWDVDKAIDMARSVKERHGAIPYGFQFITRSRGKNDLDSKVTKRSGTYFLGGRVETLAQIAKRNNPGEATLLSNMRCNGYKKVVINTNSWRWTQPLQKGDTVLDVNMAATAV